MYFRSIDWSFNFHGAIQHLYIWIPRVSVFIFHRFSSQLGIFCIFMPNFKLYFILADDVWGARRATICLRKVLQVEVW